MRWDLIDGRVGITAMGIGQVQLLREVEKFLRVNDTPPTKFGREAMGDPRFVFDLRNGRDPRPRTVARVLAYLREDQQ